ncbi:MAG: thioredoxin fold domain-containing protein [Lentisphaerae bacterium]|jgi:thioredoxin-related protein|nr:thioredoxin fold domain-containing protein [Lentisphaerota bacterium]
MKLSKWSAVGAALVMMTANLLAVDVDIDGAVPGKWTMDFDAAKKVAAEKKLPIILNFTGSDWCGWCKLMEERVFTKAEWSKYAKENMMMVFIDFPDDKTLVPEKYTDRNKALSTEYDITGYPTYIILDSDGTTKLGQLGAGQEKTPESFIAEIKKTLSNGPSGKDAFLAKLSPAKKAEYEKLDAQLKEMEKKFEKQIEAIEEAQKKAEEAQMDLMKAEGALELFRMEQELGPEAFKVYKETREKYDAAIEKLTDWIDTDPEHTDENTAFYEKMIAEIMELEAKLSEY